MKDVQKELMAISVSLASLGKQIEKMAEAIAAQSGSTTRTKRTPAARKVGAGIKPAKALTQAPPKQRKKAAPKKAAPIEVETTPPAAEGNQTLLDSILGLISRSRNGVTIEKLKKKTGFSSRQVSNALYKLHKKGKVEARSRGLYVKKE